jgi:hypothetical protein
MSIPQSKQEIKDLLVIELNNSSEKAIFNAMKNYVINTIVEPTIKLQIIYTFETRLTEDNVEVLKLICLNEWGFEPYIISEYSIINMEKFI